jgi:predicted acylesterase/phospholipase RssA
MSIISNDDQTSKKVTLANQILFKNLTRPYSELQALAEDLRQEGQEELAQSIRSRADNIKKADEDKAVRILSREKATPADMLKLAKTLVQYKQFGYARRLLDRARKESHRTNNADIYLELFQKSAVYTYKDPDLPLAWRLDRALNILSDAEDLSTTQNQETLGIAGAIYKRKWEVDGQRNHLERSLLYYLRGYSQGAPNPGRSNILAYLQNTRRAKLNAEADRGYTGINAAFILDLLAQQEEEEARRAKLPSETSNKRREDARRIRKEIIRSVPPLIHSQKWLEKEWWFYATVGEAFFGLGCYKLALDWLVARPKAAGLLVPEWEYESTARQLTRLALLKCDPSISEKEFEQTRTGQALKALLNGDDKKVHSAFRGKFGLAMSGGGFRASLYHIGVLAKLAELDVLRHVEALSCVSGGSIVGAYYYLELRKLLQRKTDDEISTQDYIDIVEKIEEHFLKGVQTNIRTRVFAEFTTNLKMVFYPGYTRTRRVGELYERELFSRIEDGEGVFERPRWLAKLIGSKSKNRYINKLYIYPFISQNKRDMDFYPKYHNWKRENKVPVIILNATCLNTGHVWQFTASYMGEPPNPINSKVDSNYRLRRMYYKDAPYGYKDFRLGYAVAASSGVPGLFEPLMLDRIYPDKSANLTDDFGIRLVDGGVYDNQGIASLLEQDCTVLLVSDASGQMDFASLPSSKAVSVLWRSNNISMARVRGIQYNDAVARRGSSLLQGLMFIHLKQELTGKAIAWKDCPDDLKVSQFEYEKLNQNGRLPYGISTDIQQQLAAIRTDLDSFSEAEAYALMVSGYRMTAAQFEGPDKCIEGFEPHGAGEWRFREIMDDLQGEGERKKHLEKLLKASSSLGFKVWSQWPLLKCIKWILLVAAVVWIGWAFYHWRNASIFLGLNVEWIQNNLTIGLLGLTLLSMIGLVILRILPSVIFGKIPGKHIIKVILARNTLKKITIGIVMCLIGWLAARVHLHVFDKIYLWYGKLGRFPKKD